MVSLRVLGWTTARHISPIARGKAGTLLGNSRSEEPVERGAVLNLLTQSLAPWSAALEGNRKLQLCDWSSSSESGADTGEREQDSGRSTAETGEQRSKA